jgi:predicted unusual protein kinase regulating ubiquinone biosynthesis (AarF/ABC1/UbiB family)
MSEPETLMQKAMNGSHKFIRFSLADIIQIVVTIVLVAGVYFKLDNRVSNLELSIKVDHDWIRQIDEGGTRKSQMGISKDQQAIEYQNGRISQLETQMRDVMPKLDRIDTNVLWLMSKTEPHK